MEPTTQPWTDIALSLVSGSPNAPTTLLIGSQLRTGFQRVGTTTNFTLWELPATVAALLGGGASVDARNESGETPLHVAATGGTASHIAALLQAGADPDVRNGRGRTPIFDSTDPTSVSALIDAGASVDVRDAQGKTPLYGRAEWGISPETIEVLLDAGVDPAIRDNQGRLARDSADGSDKLKGTRAYQRLTEQ